MYMGCVGDVTNGYRKATIAGKAIKWYTSKSKLSLLFFLRVKRHALVPQLRWRPDAGAWSARRSGDQRGYGSEAP